MKNYQFCTRELREVPVVQNYASPWRRCCCRKQQWSQNVLLQNKSSQLVEAVDVLILAHFQGDSRADFQLALAEMQSWISNSIAAFSRLALPELLSLLLLTFYFKSQKSNGQFWPIMESYGLSSTSTSENSTSLLSSTSASVMVVGFSLSRCTCVISSTTRSSKYGMIYCPSTTRSGQRCKVSRVVLHGCKVHTTVASILHSAVIFVVTIITTPWIYVDTLYAYK